ncbi:exopolysaccharide biosynthesis polyprenyl glycosylphosphotransferase [Oleiharenicola lentus]|uniref:Exopolysaccharide biosynthesis polyprenyl glycosylphosphotransferase n=1 Tax=Oleiharenicola lentus TaxID=2508720 RepID=A0A4Q1CBR2_9BACT|nr:exopolysaccharide biosynthesis polyprenyl glycosylphosphotransferase [Oleiharenicola lentus]RXK56534.1 exopolysaccharide biosynthesis polyprenyl glycosylphosphotransferase [Oleiharenicola lentus]
MNQGRSVTLTLLLLDAVVVFLVFNSVGWLYGVVRWEQPLVAALLLPLTMHVIAVYLVDGYNPRTDVLSLTYTSLHAIALLTVALLTLLLTYVFIPAGFPLQSSRFVLTVSSLLVIPLTLPYRRWFYLRRQSRRQQRSFLFLGTPESCVAFKEECRRNRMTQSVLYATYETIVHGLPPSEVSLPPMGDVTNYLEQHEGNLDAIILRESSIELPTPVADRLMQLHFSGVPTYTLELFHEIYWRKIPLYRLNQTWLFQEGFQIAREPVFERLKRISDITLASLGLLIALPLFPFVAAAIWLEDRGPVFFRQQRVGKNRVLFDILKLRTMRVHQEGALYTDEQDSRITAIGRFLRATRLDEVPQLWNVLTGDMSLIGPRAEWVKLVEDYEKKIPCYHFRHLVKPGITGWAQVNYPYGANLDDTLHKLEYDLYYIRYFSFVLDASIVLKTIHIMIFGKGR